jgi:UDP-glucose 4-epimerase
MRVLVTGGGGYIGSVAIERLIARGYDVVALDNFSRGHAAAVHPEADKLHCDLRDSTSTAQAVAQSGAEAILHFAALHLVPESVGKPGDYYQTNVSGGINLLNAARDAGITRFVFSSTAAVYGEPQSLPVRESSPKEPINPYGHSKWIVEQLLPVYAETHGLNYAAFRYFNVAGATEERGEDHDPETHIIPVALQVLLGQRDSLTVFGTDYPTPDGTAIRDYVHVADLVDAHITAIERLDSPLGAINLGTRDGFSVRQIVESINRVTGQELPIAFGDRRQGDPPALIADTTRARELVDWNPTRSTMDEMIGSAWDWMQRHPNGYES